MRKGQTLFTYLHLAASKPCTDALIASGTTSIAYETVQTADGALPLLAPMSEVAGRLAAQVGAYHLMRTHGGRGVLMGGVPGVAPAKVVVIGGGMAGDNAAAVAMGMGARVTVFDLNVNTLRKIDAEYGGSIETRYSSTLDLEEAVKQADLVIGAVLVPGAKAPKLVTNSTVAHMKSGAVLVDIAIDQGGCFEDSRPDDARRPDLRRARHGLLLRGQHARRGAAHVDLRAHQRDHALRAQARRQGLAGRVRGRPGSGQGPVHPRGRPAVRAGRRRSRAAVHRSGDLLA